MFVSLWGQWVNNQNHCSTETESFSSHFVVRLNTFVTSLHFGSSVYCEQVYVAELMADAHACAKRNSHNRTFEDINKVQLRTHSQ